MNNDEKDLLPFSSEKAELGIVEKIIRNLFTIKNPSRIRRIKKNTGRP